MSRFFRMSRTTGSLPAPKSGEMLFYLAPRAACVLASFLVAAGSVALCVGQPAAKVSFQRGIVYSTPSEGAELKLDIARPAEAKGPLPLVVCIHGGAWQGGSRSDYGIVLYTFAQAGYAAAALDYRFAPKHPFPAQIQDVRAAVRYLREHASEYGIDPERIAALGDSAGGHLALLLGVLPEDALDTPGSTSRQSATVRAVVDLYGPTDLSRWWATPEAEKGLQQTSSELLARVFGTSDRKSPALAAASPLQYIRKSVPPILTFHGDADPVVNVEQSEWLHAALKKAGAPGKLVVFPGASHGFTGETLQKTVAQTLEFLNTHLRGEAPGERIDAHVHVAPPPDAFYSLLDRLHLRLMNVTVVDPHAPGFDTVEPQTSMAANISSRSGGRIAWAATFDPAGFEKPGFAELTIRQLQSAFDRGAVAVKIYKSIGLDLKSSSGRYVLPDDPAFSPVLDMIAKSGKTLMAHLAEPMSSWRALDPSDPHYGYYKANPAWHMFQHPERPAWEQIIAARDRMLKQHPDLKVVGCHLGSLEHDVDEIAKRLDLYPNFAVDTAARVPNLARQPREKVRAFLIRYQDRVVGGTDGQELEWKDPAAAISAWEKSFERQWKFFAEDLSLPPEVLRKIFHDNAVRWIPGLGQAGVSQSHD